MTPGILSNLARATQLASEHQCAGFRFWMVLNLLGSIWLQNDADGVFIGIDSVEDFLLEGDPDDGDAVLHRGPSGQVTEIDHWPVSIGTEPLALLSREIALVANTEHRCVLLEAACFQLIAERHADLTELTDAAGHMRQDGAGLDALDFPQPVHVDLGAELRAAIDR